MRWKRIVFLAFLLALSGSGLPADVLAAPVIGHDLSVTLRPSTHEIEGRDRLSGLPPGRTEFLLAPTLVVRSVEGPEGPLPFAATDRGLSVEIPAEAGSITIFYGGQIYDQVRKATTLTFVRGDDTTGIISPEGVFLVPSSRWYPEPLPERLGRFRLRATIGDGLSVVTQGTLTSRLVTGDSEQTEWVSGVPAEGLVLVAGDYEIVSEVIDGITYSAYLSAGHREVGRLLVRASADFVSVYASILGPYPHTRWSIVENFFSSGYGMPGFTLLDPRVVAQGRRLLKPGYLDHEIVHTWLGNYVFPDYEKGNWAEGLTTYLTNYYYNERNHLPEEALRHRIRTVERFSIMVQPDRDYPLRAFTSKREEFESNIGYGKASMVFHMLRREIGDEAFFEGVRAFVRRFGARVASWDDLRRSFEEAAGTSLRRFFRQWLDRRGGPELTLKSAVVSRDRDGNYLLRGQVVQPDPPFRVDLPMAVMTAQGLVRHVLPVGNATTPFSFLLSSPPQWVAIDPDYEVFRIIPDTDLHPNLNRVLESGSPSYLRLSDSPDAQVEELLQRLKEQKGGWIIDPETVIDALGTGSVLIAGRPDRAGLPNLVSESLRFLPGAFVFNGRTYDKPGQAILYSTDNPYFPGSVVTIYAGNSPDALRRAAYLPYYRNDTYVIFEDGRPIDRGYLPYLGPRTSKTFKRR